MIHCLLLSAGESSRFGQPKALAPFGRETVVEHLLKVLISSNVDGTTVVLGHGDDLIRPFILKHININVVYNKDHKFGQTSSFCAGLRSLNNDVDAVLLLPVDYPLVKAKTINALIDCFRARGSRIVIPSFRGRKGHPPLFSLSLKPEFLALDNGQGINTVAHRHQESSVVLEVDDPGVVRTFNTPEEFSALKAQLS